MTLLYNQNHSKNVVRWPSHQFEWFFFDNCDLIMWYELFWTGSREKFKGTSHSSNDRQRNYKFPINGDLVMTQSLLGRLLLYNKIKPWSIDEEIRFTALLALTNLHVLSIWYYKVLELFLAQRVQVDVFSMLKEEFFTSFYCICTGNNSTS